MAETNEAEREAALDAERNALKAEVHRLTNAVLAAEEDLRTARERETKHLVRVREQYIDQITVAERTASEMKEAWRLMRAGYTSISRNLTKLDHWKVCGGVRPRMEYPDHVEVVRTDDLGQGQYVVVLCGTLQPDGLLQPCINMKPNLMQDDPAEEGPHRHTPMNMPGMEEDPNGVTLGGLSMLIALNYGASFVTCTGCGEELEP